MSIIQSLVVVELGWSRAPSVAGMFLSDAGARVIKIEPPGGDPLRAAFPSAFLVWNRGKESAGLDLTSREDRKSMLRLVAGADVVINGLSIRTTERLGLDYETLRTANPAIIYAAINGFPSSSAYRDIKGLDGIIAGKSGYMGRSGTRRGPLYSNFGEGSYGAAHLAVQGILAALIVRNRTGRGQRVETSLYQGLFAYDLGEMVTYQFARRARLSDSDMSGRAFTSLMSERMVTKDGCWVEFMNILSHQFAAYVRALGLEGLWEEEPFAGAPAVDAAYYDRFRTIIVSRFRERTLDEWLPVLRAEPDLVFEPVVTIEGSMSHPQIIHNGRIIEVDDFTVGKMTQVGFPATFAGIDAAATVSAPSYRQGADHIQLRSAALPTDNRVITQDTGAAPLAGTLVVELANFYSAPFAATLLANLGARVIKIEDPKGDPQRAILDGLGGEQVLEGKESVALDVRTEQGRAAALKIIAKANAVVFGFRPGTETRLGLDYETVRAVNPRCIYMFAGGYGITGPYAQRPMYGNVTRALSGGSYRQAGRWLDPALLEDADVETIKDIAGRLVSSGGGAGGDPESALGRASILMLALWRQARTGEGLYIETAMNDLNAYANAEDFCVYSGKPPMALPDEQGYGLSPTYRVYETSEGWVFLGITEAREWAAFAATAGIIFEGSATSANLTADRVLELEQAISAALSKKSAKEWEEVLHPLGVGCVAVEASTFGEFGYTDEVMTASGLSIQVECPDRGTYRRHGPTVTFSESKIELNGPCSVGQHTHEILAELGYSAEQIADLIAQKVIPG